MRLSQAPSNGYRVDIDGLRAFAVLSVLLFHLFPSLLPGGFLGVDVFFVISGYLITGIILREYYQQKFSFLHFYARRIKRIFPALFVVLVLSSLVAVLLLVPETYINFMKSARYAAAQLANFYFSQEVGYFSEGFAQQPLLHTWSLGVEEQFYLFWPFLIFLCFRYFKTSDTGKGRTVGSINKKIAVVLFVILMLSGTGCYVLAASEYNLAFYMFYTRAFEFCIGGFVALRIVPEPKTVAANLLLGLLGMLLLLVSVVFVHEDFLGRPFLQGGVWIPCLGSALLIFVNWQKSFVNKGLATVLPSSIGKISYSLYLYHWPIIIFYKVYGNVVEISAVAAAGIVLLSFVLSILSYCFVEQPARKSGISDKAAALTAVVLIIGFAFLFKTLEQQDSASWRIGRYEAKSTAMPTLQIAEGCQQSLAGEVLLFDCQNSAGADVPTVALVGDSHAPHFSLAVTTWARNNGYNVKYLGCPGCPMLLGDIRMEQHMMEDRYLQQCERSQDLLETAVVDDPNVEVVFIAQRFDLFFDGKGAAGTSAKMFFKDSKGNRISDHTGYYRRQLASTVKRMQDAGKEVIVLKQIPVFSNIDACNWEPLIKKITSRDRVCEYDTGFIERWQQPSIDFIDEFTAARQLEVFDPFTCFTVPVHNGKNMYFNTDHLNAEGVHFLAPCFAERMKSIRADK